MILSAIRVAISVIVFAVGNCMAGPQVGQNCWMGKVSKMKLIHIPKSLLILHFLFLGLFPIVNGSRAKERLLAGEKVYFGLPIEWYLGAHLTLDAVGLVAMLVDVRSRAKNRASFVKDAMYKSMYAGHGNYSVLVFNLRFKYKWYDEPALDQTMFATMSYGYSTYGIWVFQDTALFENMGDDDPKNWAYYGRYIKEGKNITFYQITAK